MEPINDLIYDASLKEAFVKQYPTAKIKDDYDEVHGERFSIELPEDVTLKDYFKFLFLTPLAYGASLHMGLCFAMKRPDDMEAIKLAFREVKGWEILDKLETKIKVKDDMIIDRRTQ
jgi:hypothetical protein